MISISIRQISIINYQLCDILDTSGKNHLIDIVVFFSAPPGGSWQSWGIPNSWRSRMEKEHPKITWMIWGAPFWETLWGQSAIINNWIGIRQSLDELCDGYITVCSRGRISGSLFKHKPCASHCATNLGDPQVDISPDMAIGLFENGACTP